MTQPSALVLLVNGVEELEAIAPVDCLRRAGAEVTMASASATLEVEGRNGIRLSADSLLESSLSKNYDLIVVPGGPGHQTLLEDSRVLELLQKQDSAGRLVASICAGPLVLEKAGILEGKAYTSFPGTQEKLPHRNPDNRVVRDGNIITSQGAGTAIDFAIALVAALYGEPKSREIAAEICH